MASLQLRHSYSNWPLMVIMLLLTCLYAFYGHFFLLSQKREKNRGAIHYLYLAAVVLSAPLIYLSVYKRPPGSPNSFSDQYFINLVTIVLPFLILGWLAWITQKLVMNTVRKEQLEKQAAEWELEYLKSQINPHFLFNTLNNIHALVYKKADTAPQAVMQLSSLLRYMIYESNARTVPLDRELEYLRDYISLQQLRYRQQGVVEMKVEGNIQSCAVAPLLFIHLLENAYKHSPSTLGAADIKMKIIVNDDTLVFTINNPVGKRTAAALPEPGGIGLQNVEKRLALLYGNRHSMNVVNEGGTFTVELKIYDLHLQLNER